MSTKKSTQLTLFDRLSRLNFMQAAKLLGPDGKQLLKAGGAHGIDIESVELKPSRFRVPVARP
jgi:hypothetical protein